LQTLAQALPPALQVRIAQQNTDSECLVHALAALCGLLDSTAPSAESAAAGLPCTSDSEHLHQVLLLLKRRAPPFEFRV
jgi:hypothetical protein